MAHEALEEGLVLVAEGAQHDEERQAALAGDAGAGGDVLARLGLDVELDPLAPVRVDRAGHDGLGVPARLEDHARRANQLADDHALGAVDDEGALRGHHGEVPHEDRLLLDLAGRGVHEARPDEDRGGEGHVLLLALLDRELRRRPQVRVARVELQLEPELAGEVLDWADVAEGLGEPLSRGTTRTSRAGRRSGPEAVSTSSRFAKEKRSGVRERDGKGLLLASACRPECKRCRSQGARHQRGRKDGRVENGHGTRQHQARGDSTATRRSRATRQGRGRGARRSRSPTRGSSPQPCHGGAAGPARPGQRRGGPGRYFSSTVAPAPSSWAFAFSASSLRDLLEHGLGSRSRPGPSPP